MKKMCYHSDPWSNVKIHESVHVLCNTDFFKLCINQTNSIIGQLPYFCYSETYLVRPPFAKKHPVWKDHFRTCESFYLKLDFMQRELVWKVRQSGKTTFSWHQGWSLQTGFTASVIYFIHVSRISMSVGYLDDVVFFMEIH